MRPIFHRHYRPLNPIKLINLYLLAPPYFHLFSLSLSTNKHNPTFSLSRTRNLKLGLQNSVKKEAMAQKTGKEETEFKVVAETLTLCINNCGFTGSPATKNMCQKCFKATSISSSSSSAGILTAHKFPGDKSIRSTSSTSPVRSKFTSETSRAVEIPDRTATVVLEVSTTTIFKKEVNRCSGCRKRVGLTGFRCRCGDLFCSEHRYSDRHECSYDYKAAGREAIARENPVVKAAKIVRV